MSYETLARPYAKAVFDHAVSGKNLDSWEQMLTILSELTTQKKVCEMLSAPDLTASQKISNMVYLAGDILESGGKNLLHILSLNQRLLLLPWIKKHYSLLRSEYEQTQEVVVYTAYDFDSPLKEVLANKLKQRFGKSITIKSIIDFSLIGGVKVCAGNWVYDDSLKARLSKLARAITL